MSDSLNSNEVEIIAGRAAEKAAEKAVIEVLKALGVDADNPTETQQDMQHLRQQRKASQKIGITVKISIILTATSGLLALIWTGIQQAAKGLV